MKMTFVCTEYHAKAGQRQGEVRIEADGVALFGHVDEKKIMPQLDIKAVFEWLAENGYTVTENKAVA
ncbi:hypothetical protein [Serratia entomophila]|uniref:hypothetical protein n=1 Tax=Serratia entomophila TaxID=42906 RepID=UPI001F324668|nr:hypothetical protein [Serratia entomophila]UIW19281.1 hypothetical protein KHA73_04840 [Serratia entomophila]